MNIQLPKLSNKDIEKGLNRQATVFETQLGYEQENLPFQYLELHPELIKMKNSPVRPKKPQEEIQHVKYSFGCISKENVIRAWFLNKEPYIQYFVLLVVILNTVALSLYNYSYRIGNSVNNLHTIIIETVCNILFGFEILILCIMYGVYDGKNTYIRSVWNCLNVITFLSTWSIYFDDDTVVQFFKMLRLFRLFRLLEEINYLKQTIDNFFRSFLQIYKILVPLSLIMYGFSVIGLHLLKGATAYRCMKDGILDDTITNLCGSFQCPEGYECVEHFDLHHLQEEDFFYGFNNFDTIYESFLAVYMYLNATGWSGTLFIFWKHAPQEICAIYFISMLFILQFYNIYQRNYMLSNLFLASFYESFIISSAIKNQAQIKNDKKIQRRHTVDVMNFKKISSNFHKINIITKLSGQQRISTQIVPIDLIEEMRPDSELEWKELTLVIFDRVLIVTSTIILCLFTEDDSKNLYNADLVMNIMTIIVIFLKIVLRFRSFFRQVANWFNLILVFGLAVTLLLENQGSEKDIYIVIKSCKALRLFELMYTTQFLGSIYILIRCLIQTLLQIKHLVILWLIVVYILAIMGTQFFSYYVLESEEIFIHYNGLGNSIMAVIMIFYNEEWHVSMYQHALYRPVWSFCFYLVIITLGQLLFMRLMQALFLNEFGEILSKEENQFPKFKIREKITKFLNKFTDKITSNKQLSQRQTEEYSNIPLTVEERVSTEAFQTTNSSILKVIVENKYYRMFILLTIAVSVVRTAIQNPLIDPESDEKFTLNVIFIVVNVIFTIELVLNILAYGFIDFIKQSTWSILNIVILTSNYVSIGTGVPNEFVFNLFDSLRILAFIKLGTDISVSLKNAVDALINAFGEMIQLSIFCFIILLIYAIFGLNLLRGKYNFCSLGEEFEFEIKTKLDCMDYGGAWANQLLDFDNISQSLNTLFVVSTSEGWSQLMVQAFNAYAQGHSPELNHQRGWAAYFQILFFIGNTILFGMFITLITKAYFQTKDEAQNLHLLNDKQREWYQIRQQIRKLKPKVKTLIPQNIFQRFAFNIMENQKFQTFFLIIIGANLLILSLYYARMNPTYQKALNIMNLIFIIIMTFEIICRIVAEQKLSYKIPIEEIGIFFQLFGWFMGGGFWPISVAFQVFRTHRIILNFEFMVKIFSAIFAVLPNALSMLLIMLILLYIYTNVGMDLFGYLRTQQNLNGYDMSFRSFWITMMTLIRVSSGELWFTAMIETSRLQSPEFACVHITNYDQFKEYGFNGCGTTLAYLYFISFQLIFSVLIFNLFIASILEAYDEFTKSVESAISKYQLNDVVKQWNRYDEYGRGFINYKLFWKLSSEIAIIFGVEQSDLLDINNKKRFLQALKIPIYEEKTSNIFCYKFHDVIISLTRISVTLKFGVTHLEPEDQAIYKKVYQEQDQDLDSNFKTTHFNSGDMASIIYIQCKFREWKHRSLLKNNKKLIITGITDIRSFVKPKHKTFIELIKEQDVKK